MEFKANLHFHTKDDIEDKADSVTVADYDLIQGLDKAKELGFNVLAVTCHNFVTNDEKYYDYAENLGINLIPGIEKTVENKHVVILNADKSAEKMGNFSDLKNYKTRHPESFIMAPHPFFDGGYSLGSKLKEHVELFDAVEYSWFHFKFLNLNNKAVAFAKKHGLPVIATSDTHDLKKLDMSYCFIDAKDNSFESLVEAVNAGKIRNVSRDAKFWSVDTWKIVLDTALDLFRKNKN